MSESQPQYSPKKYNAERAELFLKRANHSKNFPPNYTPEDGVVDDDTFIDALLGFYDEDVAGAFKEGSHPRDRKLSQMAFAIEFLEGASLVDLSQMIAHDAAASKKV